MPVAHFTLNGKSYSAQLPAAFSQASPADQQELLEQVQQHVLDMQPSAPASPLSGMGDALQSGAHQALSGVANTAAMFAKDAGNGMVGNALNDVASAAQSIDPGAPTDGYQNSGFQQDWKAGDYKAALSDLPRAIAEQAPNLAGNLGAAALGGAVGGPVGAGAGLVAYNVATGAGDNAAARAAANGDATPTPADQLVGTGLAAGQGLLQTVGLGRVPGVGKAIESLPGLVKPFANAALEGTASAAGNVAQQAGTTAGTQHGLTIDPAQVAQAGLSAAGGRFGQSAVGTAASGALNSARVSMAGNISSMSPEQQASVQRVAGLLNDLKPAKGGDMSPATLFGSAKAQIAASTRQSFQAMRDQGIITPEQYGQIVAPLITAASSKSQELLTGTDNTPQTVLDRLPELNLPQAVEQKVRETALDLQTLADASKQTRQVGPLQRAGQTIGAAAALPALLVANPTHAVLDVLAGHSVGQQTAKIGGTIGAGLDKVMGLQEPQIIMQARALAKAKGPATPGNTLANVEALRSFAADPANGQAAASQRAMTQAELDAAKYLHGQVQTLGPNDPAGQAAMTQLHAMGLPDLVQGALHGHALRQPVAIAQARVDMAKAANAQAVQDAATTQARNAAVARSNAAAAFAPTSAQAMADRTAERNQTVLDAANSTPNPASPVSLTAVNAAVNQLGKQARFVQRQGGEIMEGDGAPVVVGAAKVRAKASAMPNTTPDAKPAPSPVQMASGGDWRNYVMAGLLAHNIAAKPDHVDAAVNTLAANGALDPEVAAAMLAHRGAIPNIPQSDGLGILDRVKNAVSVGMGRDAIAQPNYGPVRDAVRWQSGRDLNQNRYAQTEAELRAENLTNAANAVRDASDLRSGADRRALFGQLPEAERAIVRARLGAKLFGEASSKAKQ